MRISRLAVIALAVAMCGLGPVSAASAGRPAKVDLWETYRDVFTRAKYVDLTHTIAPNIPVWQGFGR